VDIAPLDPDADPVRDARAIVAELKKFDKELAAKPRWLVLNKRDLMPDDEAEKRARAIVRSLRFRGPHFLISGATGRGTRGACGCCYELFGGAGARGTRSRIVCRRNSRRAAGFNLKTTGRGGYCGGKRQSCRFFTIAFITASLHCANTSSQSALVSRGFIAVDDLLVHQSVNDGDGFLVAGRGRFLISRQRWLP